MKDPPYDCVSTTWIVDCVKQQRMIPLHNRYVLNAKQSTREEMGRRMDIYGDYYVQKISEDDLELIMGHITTTSSIQQLSDREMIDVWMENEMLLMDSEMDFLAPLVFYFDKSAADGLYEIVPLLAKFRGAFVSSHLTNVQDPPVTHIVLASDIDPSEYREHVKGYIFST